MSRAHSYNHSRAHSANFQSLYLRHSSFCNPSVASPTSQFILPFFASPTSQALHLRHLSNCPCISMLVTKFSQNIVADTDENKALIDCHKCSSSFLSIVKSHPLKIPASVLEKVRSGSCLIDCSYGVSEVGAGAGECDSATLYSVHCVKLLKVLENYFRKHFYNLDFR